jgi:probable phosphoglycerate mutase
VLLRHGETDHTVQRRFSGGTGRGGDPDLSARGLQQAERAAERLVRLARDPGTHHSPHPSVDVVLTSPMLRTRRTADVVAERLGRPLEIAPGFTECDFGAWDGATFADVSARDPDSLAAWFASTATPPPQGESFDDVQARVETARDDVLSRFAGATVLVVTHVTPIKSMVRLALGAPTDALYRMELAPCSFTSAVWFADGVASLRFFNDTSHLSGLGGPGHGLSEGEEPR